MKIALIGYGKMGKTIENIALQRGHEIILKIDFDNLHDFNAHNFQKVEVAIEFTRPESVVDNLKKCIQFHTPVVCGTTGWGSSVTEIEQLCKTESSALFHTSNFSVGVNIFFAVNRYLAGLMNQAPQYNVALEEIHHTQKLDAPSGTAISLADDILKQLDRKSNWVNEKEKSPSELCILSKRIAAVPGTHTVTYDSPIDTIEITHTAHSREGFATGAVLAAEWLVGKKGVFGMKDLLGF